MMGKLTNLREIWLQNNTLSGTIPTALTSQLGALAVLRLGHNALRGCVPRDLSLKCSDGTLDCAVQACNSEVFPVDYTFTRQCWPTDQDIFDQACGKLWVCGEEENEACAALAVPRADDADTAPP